MTFQEKKYQDELMQDIARLKKEKNAVILAHMYQREEVQNIADIVGDSYMLAKAATRTNADVIVMCGVKFMAESAYILNPEKTVLLPVKEAGCTMADMVTANALIEMKKKHPGAAVVCYVNSSAEVKAESDICCTSANAVEVVNSLKEKDVIFVPDKNLGSYVAKYTDKNIILWEGFCATHAHLMPEQVVEMKKKYPNAQVVAHPECRMDVLNEADIVASTAGMLQEVKDSTVSEFIICTEQGFLYTLRKENPGKRFYTPIEHMICADMKLTTLGWIANSLDKMVHKIEIEESIRERANTALDRMLKVKA